MVMLPVEKLLVLESVEIFRGAPDDLLGEVATLLTERHVEEGEAIVRHGDMGTSMFIVVSGCVRVHIDETTLAHLHERDVFGELAAIDPEPRSATVTATKDTHLLELGQRALLELIDTRFDVALGIMRTLCERLRRRVEHRRPSEQLRLG